MSVGASGRRSRRLRRRNGGRGDQRGRDGSAAQFFREQRSENFGERGGVGDSRGFIREHLGGLALGRARIVRKRERAGKFVDFKIERFGVTLGRAQHTHAPIDSAHVSQQLIEAGIASVQLYAVQDYR